MLRVEFRMKFSAEKKIARKGLGGVVKTIGIRNEISHLNARRFHRLTFYSGTDEATFLSTQIAMPFNTGQKNFMLFAM